MKKFLNIFFVTLGAIFFILILIGMYLFVTDPLNLKPLLFDTDVEAIESAGDGIDKNPMLNESQEAALETFGIDPADVPNEISPEQEECFEDAIGTRRVEEIKAGDSPTPTEFFKVKSCI